MEARSIISRLNPVVRDMVSRTIGSALLARSLRMLEDGACVRQHFFYGEVCK